MSRILDPKQHGRYPFSYVPSAATDVSKTFARERKRLAELAEQQKKAEAESQAKVSHLTRGLKSGK